MYRTDRTATRSYGFSSLRPGFVLAPTSFGLPLCAGYRVAQRRGIQHGGGDRLENHGERLCALQTIFQLCIWFLLYLCLRFISVMDEKN